jgi:peptidoglycan/LPS O-acetylase OafA/YrhL
METTLDVVGERAPAASAARATPHALFLATRSFGALDGVRALCCLGVIKGHAGWYLGVNAFDHTYLGVDLFFVISGFLIVTLMCRERDRRGELDLQSFYARRALRIFPIYYGTVLLFFGFYLAISPWKPNGLRHYAWTFVALATYTQDFVRCNIGPFFHTWSLAMEEQFYLLWPAAERYLSLSARWLALAAVVGFSQLFNYGLLDAALGYAPGAERLPLIETTFTPIALGVCLAHLLHRPSSFALLYRVLGWRWLWVPLLAALAVVLELSTGWLRGSPRLLAQLLLAALLGSLVIRPDPMLLPLLRQPLLARLGAISYGLYLYHVFVEYGLQRAFPRLGDGPRFGATVAVTALLAELSFRYYERPLLALRSRFQR